MDIHDFLEQPNSGHTVEAGSEMACFMGFVSAEAMRLTAQLNSGYHNMDGIRELFSQIIGKPVPESFSLFPPFHTDFIGDGAIVAACII